MRTEGAGVFCLVLFLFSLPPLFADVIVLENGDRLTARIVRQTPASVFVEHEFLGPLEIQRKDVLSMGPLVKEPEKKPSGKKERQKGDLMWDRKIAAGYEFARGNSDTERFNGDLLVNRNRLWIDEWTLKGNATQEFANDKRTAQFAAGSLRYGFSLTKQLYHFTRFGVEHDYLENIKTRLLPSTGLGFWFFDSETTKLLAEAGVGYQYEFFRGGGSHGEVVLHARNFVSKKITEHVEVGSDFYYFPAFSDFRDYRLEEECFLRFLVSERFALKLKAQDQYRARPHRDAKKNDFRLASTIEYTF